jgi:Domain of unknown function (DUF4440)
MSDEASRAQAAEAARTNYQAQRDAMVAGDADALGALLADGFTLTHMTRYLQPKVEWLADVRSGEMTYHAIQDAAPTLRPLQLRIRFSRIGGSWLATDTVASTWR